MRASLIESADEHHWVLLEHRVTQLLFDATSLRLQTWALDGSVELRVAAAFTLGQPGGAARTLDPAETTTLTPVLALLRRRLASLTIAGSGQLTVEFDSGLLLSVAPTSRGEAWELQGGGTLEGMAYRSPAGGGSPWQG